MLDDYKEQYISKKEVAQIKEKERKKYLEYKKIKYLFSPSAFRFRYTYKHLEKIVEKKNQVFLLEEEKKYDYLLSSINGRSLDKEQRKAVLTDEESLLVIAGAGSGKTLTMLGKIIYLMEVKRIDPSKILCISFTNAITEDFKVSLKKVTNKEIDVMTFHKLGISIFHANGLDLEIIDENALRNIIIKQIEKEELSFFHQNNLKQKQQLVNLIETFIHLFKAGGYTKDHFETFIENAKKLKNRFLKKKELLFLEVTYKIYMEYETKLEKENKIDFDDMIKEATSLLLNGGTYKKYDYILVDEYQDTSYIRYELVKALQDIGNSKVMAVGDDFQAIYKFTGCTLENFLHFETLFPYSTTLKIQMTYRNPQELIDVAGSFVMKNKKQIPKELKSQKSIKKPIHIFFYETKKEFISFLDIVLATSPSSTYYILGRNNHDMDFLYDFDEFKIVGNTIVYMKEKERTFYYYTVHKSKGLECDNVILINLEDSILGFPSQLTDDPVLRYVVKKEIYPYEEERRLFYVALTRTKNNVYLFCPKNNVSSFVKELLEENRKNIEIFKNKKKNLEENKKEVKKEKKG